MKATIEYIGEEADRAIEEERKTPRISAAARERATRARMSVVAGLVVEDEQAERTVVSAAERDRNAAFDQYFRDRASIKSALEARGVTPLATLPAGAWHNLCQRSGLFRLSPDREGKVGVSLRPLTTQAQQFSDSGTVARIVFGSAFAVPMFVGSVIGWLAYGPLSSIAWGCLVGLFAGCAISLALLPAEQIVKRFFSRLYLRRYLRRSWGEQLSGLFPKGVSQYSEITGSSEKLVLPTPPADVAATLFKIRNFPFNLSVAAVADAISFERSIEDMLKVEVSKMARERQQALDADPIVYCEHGSAVVLIAQFGNFPIEKQVVDQVLNSEYLINS